MSDNQQEAQRLEWEQFERREIAERRCPASGSPLMRRTDFDGPLDPRGAVMACSVCDCFGYRPDEVGPTTPDLSTTERQL